VTVFFDEESVAALGKIAVCFEEQSSCEKTSGDGTMIEVARMPELEKSLIQDLNLAYGA
jgi:hypothetical protein